MACPLPQLVEHGLDRLAVLMGVLVGAVHHLQQQVGTGDLLERGAEGGDELVGQLVDEAHRVGEQRPTGRSPSFDLPAWCGSSVAKSWSSARAASRPLSALSSEDLPALV